MIIIKIFYKTHGVLIVKEKVLITYYKLNSALMKNIFIRALTEILELTVNSENTGS